MSRHAEIGEPDAQIGSAHDPQRDPLVRNDAVPRNSLQSFAQSRRRSHDVVEQSEGTQIQALAHVKPEQFIVQSLRGKVEELDLVTHCYANCRIINLTWLQTGAS